MKYLLDTNVCIAYLIGRSANVSTKLRTLSSSDVAICSVVKAELLYGARKSARADSNLAKLAAYSAPLACVPFDDAAAECYGIIRAELERGGTPIGPNDLMIAATALARGLTLVTANLQEFGRVRNLNLENWQ